MAHDDGEIYWHDPDPRAILPLEDFHVSQSLRRVIRKREFEVKYDSAFAAVIHACAEQTLERPETWINAEIISAYIKLSQLGFAHSVEVWQGGKLVGGLYGVAVQGLFAGESMFSRVSNSSKVALFYLVQRLRKASFKLLDVQFMTDHLRQFGAIEISANEYRQLLAEALQIPSRF